MSKVFYSDSVAIRVFAGIIKVRKNPLPDTLLHHFCAKIIDYSMEQLIKWERLEPEQEGLKKQGHQFSI